MPFFGINRKTGEPVAYWDLLKGEPGLVQKTAQDESHGVYFNNGETLRKKVEFALKENLGGVMIWEIGQDVSSRDPGSLLAHVWNSAETAVSPHMGFPATAAA